MIAIIAPFGGIVFDILRDFKIVVFIAHDMFVEGSLP